MRSLLSGCGISLAILWLSAPLRVAFATPPHLILITADDLGYGDLGVTFQNARPEGRLRLRTPQLDRMAAEGTLLRHHYAGAPVCVSSRAVLYTGRNAGHVAVRDSAFDFAWPSSHPSLATTLRAVGYRTALIGKYGLAGGNLGSTTDTEDHPLRRGFDYFYGHLRHAETIDHYPGNSGKVVENFTAVTNGLTGVFNDDLFVARAKQFLVEHVQSQPATPLFLMLHFTSPHFDLQYPPVPYPAGGGLTGGMPWPPPSGAPEAHLHPDLVGVTYDHDQNPATAPVAWPESARRYAALVRRLDDSIGDLLQLLRDLGLDGNSVVVFTSDHGPDFNYSLSNPHRADPRQFDSAGPFDGCKNWLLEGGLRVPTLVWAPGRVPAAQTNDTVGSHADWLPTLLDFAGQPPPAWSTGRTLRGALQDPASARPAPPQYFEHLRPSVGWYDPVEVAILQRKGLVHPAGLAQMVRWGEFSAIRFQATGEHTPLRLYRVATDPFQSQDLAGLPEHAATVAAIRRHMLAARRPLPLPPFVRELDQEDIPARGLGGPPGLRQRRFSGSWPWLPDFGEFTPAATGVVASIALPTPTAPGPFGLEFRGYLQVPHRGQYQFHLAADGAAGLWIHDASLIAEDLLPFGERTAHVRLMPGAHPFRLASRHPSATPLLRLEISGPGLPRRPVGAQDFHLDLQSGVPPPQGELDVDVAAGVPTLLDPRRFVPGGSASSAVPVAPQPAGLAVEGEHWRFDPSADTSHEVQVAYAFQFADQSHPGRLRLHVHRPSSDLWLPFDRAARGWTRDANGRQAGLLEHFGHLEGAGGPGRLGAALFFDGVDDRVRVVHYTPPLGATPRTVAAWVKPESSGPVVSWGQSTTGWKWFLEVASPGAPGQGVARLAVGNGFLRGTTNLRDGLWHHLVAVFPPGVSAQVTNALLYVDGQREPLAEILPAPVTTQTSEVWIGGDLHGQHLRGWIDEVRILPRALSAAEIGALAQPGPEDYTAAFRRRHFADAVPDWSLDPEGDGLPHALEFAFGGQPGGRMPACGVPGSAWTAAPRNSSPDADSVPAWGTSSRPAPTCATGRRSCCRWPTNPTRISVSSGCASPSRMRPACVITAWACCCPDVRPPDGPTPVVPFSCCALPPPRANRRVSLPSNPNPEPPMSLGINLMLWTATPDRSHAKLIQQLRKAGYRHIELPVFNPAAFPVADLKEILDGEGMTSTVTSCLMPDQGTLIHKDRKRNQAALGHVQALLDVCQQLGASVVCGPLYHPLAEFTGTGPTDAERSCFAEHMRKLGSYAEHAKVKIGLEPLNRFETHFLNTCAQGAEVCAMIDHPLVGLLVDTFHMHIEEDDMAKAMLAARKHIVHLHASENHRGRPGSGQVRWKKWSETVRKMKYKGHVVVESFGQGLPELAAATRIWRNIIGDPVKMAAKAAKFLKPLI
jgi:arylsulfatase A-like enzyme/sugar phosphate isomerase/epimerase